MSFEEAASELEEIVNKFESEQVSLEDAINNYARAEELKKCCEKKLSEAKLKVEKIISSNGSGLKVASFDEDE